MALIKDIVPLPIDLGLNTKFDQKQEEIGYLRVAENIVYETLKLIKKRNGYDLHPLEDLSGNQLSDVRLLSKFKKELIALTSSKLSAFSPTLQKWVDKGSLYPTEVKSKVILRNSSNQARSSGFLLQGFEIFAWEDSRGGLRYSVMDSENKNFLVSDAALSSSGNRPIVANIQNTVYILYVDGSDLKYKKFDLSTPSTLSNAVTSKTNVDSTDNLIDAASTNDGIVCAYNSSAGEVSIFKINSSGNSSSSISFAGQEASQCLSINVDSQGRVLLAWSSGLTLYACIYAANFAAAILSPTLISTETSAVKNVTICQDDSELYRIFWEVSASIPSNHYIKKVTLDLQGNLTALNDNLLRSVGLASKCFSREGTIFLTVVHDSELQPTNFVIDENAYFVSKFNNQNASGLIEHGTLNDVFSFGDGRYLIPSQTRGRNFSNDGAFYSLLGVSSVILNFEPERVFQNAFLAENLHICAGILKMYDGNSVSEHGYHVFPENLQQISPIPGSTEITVEGQAAVSEVQLIKFSREPNEGTFTLTLGAETTSPIGASATTGTIKSAIEALPSVEEVTVSGSFASGFTITFVSPQENLGLLQVTNNNLGSTEVLITATEVTKGVPESQETQKLTYSQIPDAGSFVINVGGQVTGAIAYNASNATIKAELEALSNITTATVTGSPIIGHSITIDDPIQNFPIIVIQSNSLTSSGNAVTVYASIVNEGIAGVKEVQSLQFNQVPIVGNYSIEISGQTTASLAFNASNATIKAALEALSNINTATVTGSYAAGLTITIDDPFDDFTLITNPLNTLIGLTSVPITATTTVLTEGVSEIKEQQTLTFESVPISGSFTITIGAETTTAINYSMGASDIKAALEALTAITSCTVTGSFASGFTITFDNPVTGIALMSITDNSLSSVAISGGQLTDGNRAYLAVYKWTDNVGQDHQSAPSLPALEINFNAGTDTQSARIRVPTLRLTEKQEVVIDLYGTEADGTVFYKITDNLNPVFNDKTVDYVDIDVTIPDSELISRELLYTTGNKLENIAAPACSLICVYDNRLAVVGEDENRVFFSKQVEEGKPVEYTDLISKYFEPIGGGISAIDAISDKFVAFQNDACHWIGGSGLDNFLQGEDFTSAEIIASDIGCINPDSVVLTPNGLMFKSRKGIYTLNNSLQLNYTGNKVESFNSLNITCADVVGELNQIRFVTDTSIALVYNYNLDRWATFTNHGGLSSVVIENDYYYLREDGKIYKENRSSFSDASSTIKMRIQTGWLSFAQMQGFQRVYHALILGSYKSAHNLLVKTAFNFIEAFQEQANIDVSDFIDATPYGDYSPYGDPANVPYGGSRDSSLYQARVNLKQQKCQAIKIQIEDVQDSVGEGLNLSSLTLRVGMKQGNFALPAANKFGSK